MRIVETDNDDQGKAKKTDRYSVARKTANFLYLIGFLLVALIAIITPIMVFTGSFKTEFIFPAGTSVFVGIVTMANAQLIGAVLDTADSTRKTAQNTAKILEEIRSKSI